MGEWKSGLFGCFDDIGLCLKVYFLPCIAVGILAEKTGVADSCLIGGISLFVPLLNLFCLWKIRGAVRDKKSIDGSPVKDCLEVWCCGLCAAVQECKEMDVDPLDWIQRQ